MLWSKKCACVFILATVLVKATGYFESDVKTTWANITCNLAEPQLTYNNGIFMVYETLTNINDVWIGYIYAKVPFLLLGCATGQTQTTYDVTDIGDCFTICEAGNFGIQPKIRGENNKSISCICSVNMVARDCVSHGQGICKNGCYEIYTQMNVNIANASIHVVEEDCLTYFYPSFAWSPCNVTQGYPKIMCSKGAYTVPSAEAIILNGFASTWWDANKQCLYSMYPASVQSITNAGFNSSHSLIFWTGIVRSWTLIKNTSKGVSTRFSVDSYAYVNRSSNILGLAKSGEVKKALCQTVTASTTVRSEASEHTTASYPPTEVKPISTPENSVTSVSGTKVYIPNVSSTDVPTKALSIGLGIGVSVGILFLIGGAIVIVVLKRRGIIPCNRKTKDNKPSADKPVFEENKTNGKGIDDNVPFHNYVILDKCGQSINDHIDHNNETIEANMEANYNTIHETDEPYEHVKEENHDYDYTANALTSGSNARKPDNVYNKLNVVRPGDYDHIGRRGHEVANASCNKYDTTSAVLEHIQDDVFDYNHIPHTGYKADGTGGDIKDVKGGDYDAINSMKFKVAQSDASDYAHVNTDRI